MVTWKKDGVFISRLLFQLDGDWHQLVGSIHIEQTDGSTGEVAFATWQVFHDLEVADVNMASLDCVYGWSGYDNLMSGS